MGYIVELDSLAQEDDFEGIIVFFNDDADEYYDSEGLGWFHPAWLDAAAKKVGGGIVSGGKAAYNFVKDNSGKVYQVVKSGKSAYSKLVDAQGRKFTPPPGAQFTPVTVRSPTGVSSGAGGLPQWAIPAAIGGITLVLFATRK